MFNWLSILYDIVAFFLVILQHRLKSILATDNCWDCPKFHWFLYVPDNVAYSTILELRDRIEALEAAAKPNHPAKLDGSLVERVAAAMHPTIYAGPPYLPSPRAVIREVAAWLREHYGGPTATTDLLEQEAKLAALGDQAG